MADDPKKPSGRIPPKSKPNSWKHKESEIQARFDELVKGGSGIGEAEKKIEAEIGCSVQTVQGYTKNSPYRKKRKSKGNKSKAAVADLDSLAGIAAQIRDCREAATAQLVKLDKIARAVDAKAKALANAR